MNLIFTLLQTTDPGIFNIIFFVGVLVVFYFFLIRPQQKRQKEEKTFRENLQKNDKVITIGGIYGHIISIEETTVLLRVDENVKVRVEKSALRAATETSAAKEKTT